MPHASLHTDTIQLSSDSVQTSEAIAANAVDSAQLLQHMQAEGQPLVHGVSDDEDDLMHMVSQEQPEIWEGTINEQGRALLATAERSSPMMAPQRQLQLIEQVKERLAVYGTGQDKDFTASEQWLQQQTDLLLPLSDFKAGITRHHAGAWEAWLQLDPSPNAKQALEIIREGVKFDFVHPEAESQQAHPRHRQLIAEMRAQLQAAFGTERAERMLDADKPQPASFPNRVSATMHEEFVMQEAKQLREWGVLKTPQEVGLSDEDIILVIGVAVVVNRKAKQRMIFDARCAT